MPAIRLTFAYDAGGVRLIDRTPVDKRVPPHAGEEPMRPTAVRAELRAADGRMLYRRTLRGAIPRDVEVFHPGRGEGAIYRVPEPPTAGAFSVIVPDDGDAVEAVLFAAPATARRLAAHHPPDQAARSAAAPIERGAAIIGRFALR